MRRVQGRLPATNIVLAEEQDAEDQKEDRDVTINVPEETDFADAAVNYIEATADIPYATAAKIGMNLMLSHELGQYRPQGMETCALCEEDDSVDDDKKRHTYTVGHLREHVASDFYTPYKQWIRRAHQNRDARMAADLDDRDFTCPNCMEAAGDSESFKAMKKSTLHIWRSNSKNIAGKNDWTTPENSAKRKFDSPFLCRDNRESSGPSLAKLLTRTPRTRIPVSLLELRLVLPAISHLTSPSLAESPPHLLQAPQDGSQRLRSLHAERFTSLVQALSATCRGVVTSSVIGSRTAISEQENLQGIRL